MTEFEVILCILESLELVLFPFDTKRIIGVLVLSGLKIIVESKTIKNTEKERRLNVKKHS
jgi:hypothetical protein